MEIKEILILHHSHFDIGYTHTQPVLWELQREFIDAALKLLEETKDWPENSAPRWTIEATGQVLKWLKDASSDKIELFKQYAMQKRIGISAMLAHTTPLANSEQLARQLYPIKNLRQQFNIKINTLNQHDVNGVPWTMVDLMLDSGIELLTMAVNLHFGGAVADRPSVFLWRGPSGRKIKVMNGAHYTMLDQHLDTHKNDLNEMRKGLNTYLEHLEQKKYPHDFLYLTTANPPVCYDNSPPNPDVAKLIRQWNDENREPLMRYVTPEQLLERINQIPENELPVHTGDWTDYWNFGCSSNAMVTKTNLNSKPRIYTADALAAVNGINNEIIKKLQDKAWWNFNLYDEHTWGSFNSLQPESVFTRVQANFKDNLAYNAREITEYLIVHELEALADNPDSSYHQDGVLIVNTSANKRKEYIPVPDWWHQKGKRLRTARFGWNNRYEELEIAPLYGPIEIEPHSWKQIPLKKLRKAATETKVKHGKVNPDLQEKEHGNFIADVVNIEQYFIESEYYRLEYDQPTGRITSLHDKKGNWQVIDQNSPWHFFGLVQEEPDRLVNPGRAALYARDMMGEKFDVSLWQKDWKARRQGPLNTKECRIDKNVRGITLVTKYEAPGIKDLEQHITLFEHSPYIELKSLFYKEDIWNAEATYFSFPLNLSKNWRCHFDTAGIPTELDHEQLPGACRDWLTVESFVSVHHENKGVSLICPDAPMVQVGDYNFGRKHNSIPRNQNPLLLAWPLNNYWDTNFRASQPGVIELTYFFKSHGAFDSVENTISAKSQIVPLEIHPLINCPSEKSEKLFDMVDSDNINVLHVKQAEDGKGIIFRLINLSDAKKEGKLALPNKKLQSAYICTILEENLSDLKIVDNAAVFTLDSRKVSTIRLVPTKG